MSPKEKLHKLKLESYYKRINFRCHLIPIVQIAIDGSQKLFDSYGSIKPFVNIISDDWLTLQESSESEIWSDSISINFGIRPIPIGPIVPHKDRIKILSEKQASLVISQSVSGDVIALIYPPKSDILFSNREFYIFERWNDPTDITVKKIQQLLRFTLEINNYTQALVFPNRRGCKAIIKLEHRADMLTNGGSKVWLWIVYAFKLVSSIAKLYVSGMPNK